MYGKLKANVGSTGTMINRLVSSLEARYFLILIFFFHFETKVALSIGTGLLTSLCAIASLISVSLVRRQEDCLLSRHTDPCLGDNLDIRCLLFQPRSP